MSILDPQEQAGAESAIDTTMQAPAGHYLCRVSSVAKWKPDSMGNANSLAWKYKVGEGEWAGKEFTEWTGLGPGGTAGARTKARFESLGFPLSAEEAEIVGTVVRVTVGVDEYNGKPTNPVTQVVRVLTDLPDEPAVPSDEPEDVFGG